MKKTIANILTVMAIVIFAIAVTFTFSPAVLDTIRAFLFGAVSVFVFWIAVCLFCVEKK